MGTAHGLKKMGRYRSYDVPKHLLLGKATGISAAIRTVDGGQAHVQDLALAQTTSAKAYSEEKQTVTEGSVSGPFIQSGERISPRGVSTLKHAQRPVLRGSASRVRLRLRGLSSTSG